MLKRHFLLSAAMLAALGALAGCATPGTPVRLTSVTDTIAAQPRLTTLSGLIARAGLADTLRASGPFTVFAPSNEAFAKVPAKTMDALAQDPARLKAVLSYHVLPEKTMAADARNGNVNTLQGTSVALARAGDFLTIDDALVQTPDIAASNGVVHVVDSVLMPPPAK